MAVAWLKAKVARTARVMPIAGAEAMPTMARVLGAATAMMAFVKRY